MTKRTTAPSEWFSTFNNEKRYVYLHLTGNRRLYGWPFEWPDHPDSGHFVIAEPAWLLDDNALAPLYLTHRMLIRAADVEMVEFEKWPNERNVSDEQLQQSINVLMRAREPNDSESRQEDTD